MAMTVRSIVYGRAVKLWSSGTFLCVQLILRTFRLCWRIQLFLLCFPFQCIYRITIYVKNTFFEFIFGSKRVSYPKNMQASDHQCHVAEKMEVLNSIQELRAGSLVAISKMNNLKRRVERYQKQVAGWRSTVDKHSDQLSALAYQEGKLVRVIMRALRSFKRLKTSKNVAEEKLLNAVQEMRGSYCKSWEGVCVAANKSVVSDTDHFLEVCNNKQIQFLKDYETNSEKCITPEEIGNHSHADLVNLSMGALNRTMKLLNAENSELRKRLKATTKQLKDVKHTSHCLNEKVSILESQLEQVNEILRAVEAERDIMKDKLLTLNGMIEEEEVFLNEESFSEDSYSELYVNPKEFSLSDVDVSNATDHFGKIEHMEFELNSLESGDFKSLELISSK